MILSDREVMAPWRFRTARKGLKRDFGRESEYGVARGHVGRERDGRKSLQIAHCLVIDGAYEEQNDGELRFLAAAPPTPERMTAAPTS